MFLRLVSVVLATVSVNPWDTVGFTETTRVRNELIGPVRSVTVKKHGYSTIETYDRAGHLIEAVLDLTHANTATHSLFQYNQDGHLQEELAFDQNGRVIYRKHVIYARDLEGRDTASVTASDDGRFQSAEFSLYDQRGHLWEQLSVSSTTGYKSLFDIQGHRIYSAYYRRGELLNELKHRYDVLGRLQELVSYDAQGTLIGRVLNDYDEAGKRIRSTTHTFGLPQPRTWITTYEYDSLGNWIKEETTEKSSSSQPAKAFTIPIVEERTIQYYDGTDSDAVAHP
jgi:YD repeat-containing protein